jgi:hypothetical protein
MKMLLINEGGGTHVKVLAAGLAVRRCSGEPIEQTLDLRIGMNLR